MTEIEDISSERFYQSLDLAVPEVLIACTDTLPRKLSHDIYRFVYETRRLLEPGKKLYFSILKGEEKMLGEDWQSVMEYTKEETECIVAKVQPIMREILCRAESYYIESKQWEDTESNFRTRFA